MATKPKIVIVGGGIAGLAAASRLYRSGFVNVTILEASDRLGGRIHSLKVDEKNHGYIEMGAEWIHGQIANVAYKLANDNGLVQESESRNLQFVLKNQKSILNSDLVNQFENLAEKLQNPSNLEFESFGEYIDNEDLGNLPNHLKIPFKDWYHRLIRSTDACTNWYELSLPGMAQYEELEGGDVPFKSKYEDLCKIFKQDLPYNSYKVSSPVSKIESSQDKVQIWLSTDQECIEADVVICTVSLGVLKRNSITFLPQFSSDKCQAIQTLGFGTINKIFVEFELPWILESKDLYLFFLYPESSNYTKVEAEKDWTRFILGVYQVIDQPKLASFWLAGHGAKLIEELSDKVIKQGIYKIIEEFNPSIKELTNLSDNPIVKITKSKWNSNPYVCGSYSYPTVDSFKAGLGPEDLARPEGFNRILFAGEATSSKHYSTVHGAIESGWREADRIIISLTETVE